MIASVFGTYMVGCWQFDINLPVFFLQIDILVNNGGRTQRGLILETTGISVNQAMFQLNVLGTISLTKAVLPHMVERNQGHIVVTSSIAGKVGKSVSGV